MGQGKAIRYKIIIVDDCPGDRGLIYDALQPVKRMFPQTWIVEFSNAEEALEEIEENDVALIISDGNLGDEHGARGGIKLLEAVHDGLGREYPFILISGCDETLAQAKRAEAELGIEIWTKPKDLPGWTELTGKVRKIIKDTRLETRLKRTEDGMDRVLGRLDEVLEGMGHITKASRDHGKSIQELMSSDDRVWAKFITGLLPRKWTKKVRDITGRAEALKDKKVLDVV